MFKIVDNNVYLLEKKEEYNVQVSKRFENIDVIFVEDIPFDCARRIPYEYDENDHFVKLEVICEHGIHVFTMIVHAGRKVTEDELEKEFVNKDLIAKILNDRWTESKVGNVLYVSTCF